MTVNREVERQTKMTAGLFSSHVPAPVKLFPFLGITTVKVHKMGLYILLKLSEEALVILAKQYSCAYQYIKRDLL